MASVLEVPRTSGWLVQQETATTFAFRVQQPPYFATCNASRSHPQRPAHTPTPHTDTMKLEGAFTALVTPFSADGKSVDYEKLREIVEWQIQEGINGLVPVSASMTCPLLQAVCSFCCLRVALECVWIVGAM